MKFGIRSIESIKFFNKETGEELKDIREIEPIKKKISFDKPILELVKESTPSYEALNHPLIQEHGYYYGGVYEIFRWEKSLNDLDELTLWKIFGIINALDANEYDYALRMQQHKNYVKKK